ALELDKGITVASKMAQPGICSSLRRNPRGGIEQEQLADQLLNMEGLSLPNMLDGWS
nr:hypothetical protein [Tanacetum cinerariifolium]